MANSRRRPSMGPLTRSMRFELLEARRLMTADDPLPWQNPNDALDVNDDGYVTPCDAWSIANAIVADEAGLPQSQPADSDGAANATKSHYDTNGDGRLGFADLVAVVLHLNEVNGPARISSETGSQASSSDPANSSAPPDSAASRDSTPYSSDPSMPMGPTPPMSSNGPTGPTDPTGSTGPVETPGQTPTALRPCPVPGFQKWALVTPEPSDRPSEWVGQKVLADAMPSYLDREVAMIDFRWEPYTAMAAAAGIGMRNTGSFTLGLGEQDTWTIGFGGTIKQLVNVYGERSWTGGLERSLSINFDFGPTPGVEYRVWGIEEVAVEQHTIVRHIGPSYPPTPSFNPVLDVRDVDQRYTGVAGIMACMRQSTS